MEFSPSDGSPVLIQFNSTGWVMELSREDNNLWYHPVGPHYVIVFVIKDNMGIIRYNGSMSDFDLVNCIKYIDKYIFDIENNGDAIECSYFITSYMKRVEICIDFNDKLEYQYIQELEWKESLDYDLKNEELRSFLFVINEYTTAGKNKILSIPISFSELLDMIMKMLYLISDIDLPTDIEV